MSSQQDLRLQVLLAIYSIQRNDPRGFVGPTEIKKQANITDSELEGIVKYLEEKGLIKVKWVSGGFFVEITSEGVDEIECSGLLPHDISTKDEELQKKILDFLYNVYSKDPHSYVKKKKIC
jgi:DNA-binding MarR family transcriptional regulator